MRTLVLFIVIFSVGACQSTAPKQSIGESEMATPEKSDVMSGTGTIVFNDFEGGFYGIVSDGGRRYFPDGLDEAFKVDGLRVEFEVRLLRNVMTIVMWGQPVTVVALKKLDG